MILLDSTLGLDFIDEHMIELANYLKTFTDTNLESGKQLGQVLGAIFAVIVAGIEAYRVMSKQQGFDIMAIGRPILFAFALANWGGICELVTFPGAAIESAFREDYEKVKEEVVMKREKRKEVALQMAQALFVKKAAAEEVEKTGNTDDEKSIWGKALEYINDGGEWLMNLKTSIGAIIQTQLQNWIEGGIVWLGELFWQINIYFIFLIKAIFTAVLTIFGPITFACALLPIWKDAWSQWIGRMVSVSLYGAMAYLVMVFSMQLMKYGIEVDTELLTKVVNDEASMTEYTWSGFGTSIQTVVGMVCGGMALKTVPEIATWVVPSHFSHGAGQFVSGTVNSIKGLAKGIK